MHPKGVDDHEAFDNLPGAGKPLPDRGQLHDPLWWVKQLVEREQLSLLPPSLQLLRTSKSASSTSIRSWRGGGGRAPPIRRPTKAASAAPSGHCLWPE
jgi:hypothetical protein